MENLTELREAIDGMVIMSQEDADTPAIPYRDEPMVEEFGNDHKITLDTICVATHFFTYRQKLMIVLNLMYRGMEVLAVIYLRTT